MQNKYSFLIHMAFSVAFVVHVSADAEKEDLSEGPFIFRDDPDQRAICNQITTKDACNDDRQCSWNVFQAMCNDHGYQPFFETCNACGYVAPPPTAVAKYLFDSPGSTELVSVAGDTRPLTFDGGMDASRWGTETINGREVNTLRFEGDGSVWGSAEGLPGGDAPRSLAGWFKRSASATCGPFGWGVSGNNNAYYVRIADQNLELDYYGQDEGINPVIENMEHNHWYHVVFTYDGIQNVGYVDGQFIRTGAPAVAPNTQTTGDAKMFMGKQTDDGGTCFKGSIAEVSVYDQALSAQDVTDLFDAGPQS